MLFRQMLTTSGNVDWDNPLDDSFHSKWSAWVSSTRHLQDLSIPRMCCKFSVIEALRKEVHIFTDASKDAIAAVAFLKVWKDGNNSDVGFLMGKAKVAPAHAHTIPRLELCGAVLGTEIAEIIKEHMDLEKNDFWFYSDARRFYVYVANRVSRIRSFSDPEQWRHIATDQNPADLGTRAFDAQSLPQSTWLRGPAFLREDNLSTTLVGEHQNFAFILDDDKEARPMVEVNKTSVEGDSCDLVVSRLERFSQWTKLVRSIAIFRHILVTKNLCEHSTKRWHYCPKSLDLNSLKAAEMFILKEIQKSEFRVEIESLNKGKPIPKNSSIIDLAPFLDSNGLLRVVGRIGIAQKFVSFDVHPIIIPKKSHVATLLIRHFHDSVFHQGRRITEGKIRSSGFWIIGAKRLIASEIHGCITCRRLRGVTFTLYMFLSTFA
ncbi:uncharacterized protein LOC133198456 [Saccostrea echinata]|uniref:uncharacterized protein LOC133198456 n=1 Tax=Saccostrea echinata TaxID=191078 RepID=UPI002A7FB90D|nr:uncharacterized protein LOC133198456 [Saccostrea echinata]